LQVIEAYALSFNCRHFRLMRGPGGRPFRLLPDDYRVDATAPRQSSSQNGRAVASIFFLSIFAMFNPTLLAAVTVMMLLPDPKRLMLGYLLGAYLTSISLGLLIVFSLHGSSSVSTARHTLSPVEDIVVGSIALLVAYVLGTGRTARLQERRRLRKEAKAEKKGEPKKSLPERLLGRGSARLTFVVGVLLTFPGVSYLAALDRMAKLDAGNFAIVLLVVGFCIVQQLLLELPLFGYLVAPEWTADAVVRFRAWLARSGGRVATIGAATIGVLLLIRGLITLFG
jgi:Sap, sulfolipid-1-addressing protein